MSETSASLGGGGEPNYAAATPVATELAQLAQLADETATARRASPPRS